MEMPYTPPQRNGLFASAIITGILSTVGAVLLWLYAVAPPDVDTTSFHLQTLAAPIAVLLGITSIVFHNTHFRDMRYITYALALTYLTQSSYSVSVFRLT